MGAATTQHTRQNTEDAGPSRPTRTWPFEQRSPGAIGVTACFLVVLSAIDAAMTLTLLPLGAVEWNPLMRALIDRDPSFFLLSKLLLTASGALVLAVLSTLAPARQQFISLSLRALTAFYAGLVIYELVLLRNLA